MGHFASPRTEVAQVGGIFDREFTGQARSSFASVEDMPFSRGMNNVGRSFPVDMSAHAGMSDDRAFKRDPVMGSQPRSC